MSDRRLLGGIALASKRFLRRLLTSVIGRQAAYNRSNLRVVSELQQRLAALADGNGRLASHAVAGSEPFVALRAEIAEVANAVHRVARAVDELSTLRGQADGLASRLDTLATEQDAFRERLDPVRNEVNVAQEVAGRTAIEAGKLNHRLTVLERRLRRMLHLVSGEPVAPAAAPPVPAPQADALEPAFDSLSFEDHFRGSEAEIRDRQRVYLPWFEGRSDVLDIGCGRGEFLELLRDGGIGATGVDTDLDVALACRDKGLHVVHGDAFEYLRAVKDGTLGGVFAAQVVEHLEAKQIVELVNLAYRKLQAGAVLILETVNPTCLTIFAESFYLDLTHLRPIHPAALHFLVHSAGFGEIEIRWSAPVDPAVRIPALPAEGRDADAVERFNRAIERVNDLLYGYRDYAVIARKVPAPT